MRGADKRGVNLLWPIIGILITALFLAGCSTQSPAPKPAPLLPRVADGVSVDGVAMGGLTVEELRQKLNQKAAESNSEPRSARFDDDTGEIVPEQNGLSMDIDQTAAQILSAQPNASLSSVSLTVIPPLTKDMLKQAPQAGAYTTPILDTSPGRVTNIRLTAKLINNCIIRPGEKFSFNRVTGEPTRERGFQDATVIGPGGMKTTGIGGGMCQVSSTLYNAVMNAGLSVVERHPHSQPVSYVPPGRDATTFTDKDFRFMNTAGNSVMIRAFTHRDNLTVELWYLPR